MVRLQPGRRKNRLAQNQLWIRVRHFFNFNAAAVLAITTGAATVRSTRILR